MRVLDKIVLGLVVIGAINWGLIGFFGFNLVAAIFGEMTILSRFVYMLVGISALWSFKFFMDRSNRATSSSY